MDINQTIEHGRRWLAAGWRWAPGQVAIASKGDHAEVVLVTDVRGGAVVGLNNMLGHASRCSPESLVPNARDAGTRGHMLDQVREAWGDPLLCTRASYNLHGELWWSVTSIDRENADLPVCGRGAKEAEALLAAREATP